MTINEIKDLPTDEIRAQLEGVRESLFRIRFQAKGKDIENPGRLKNLRKEVARMLTVLRQRELARG